MTAKQGKLLVICATAFVGSYLVRSIVTGAMQAMYVRQQVAQAARRQAMQAARRKKAPQPPAAAANPRVATGSVPGGAPVSPPSASSEVETHPNIAPPAATTPAPSFEPSFGRLAGVWQGQGALSERGVCTLRFELRQKGDEPGHFAGYSNLVCNSAPPLMSKKRSDPASAILNSFDPEAAVLAGTVEGGAIQFRVDKTIGADSRGCAVSSFVVTPFGTNLIDAAWEETQCSGGHIILRRVSR